MNKKFEYCILAVLVLSMNCEGMMAEENHGNTPECFSFHCYHYWALDLVITDPIISISSPPVENRINIKVNENLRNKVFESIIGNLKEDDIEKLSETGLECPSLRNGCLYFDLKETLPNDLSGYIKYDGKVFLAFIEVTPDSRRINLSHLKGINEIDDDLSPKKEIVETLLKATLNEEFSSTIYEFHEYAESKNWSIKGFPIFTEYFVNINQTADLGYEINGDLHTFLKDFAEESGELQIYPKNYTDQNLIELRGSTTNIVFYDDSYKYWFNKRDDEFDIYILLKSIEKVCEKSLNVLNSSEIREIPTNVGEIFSGNFKEKWDIVSEILEFMNEAALIINEHKSLFPLESTDRWVIEYRYEVEISSIETDILVATARSLNYDSRYSRNWQLAQSEKIMILAEDQLKNAKCLLVISILSLIISVVISIVIHIWTHKSQLKNFNEQNRIFKSELKRFLKYFERSSRYNIFSRTKKRKKYSMSMNDDCSNMKENIHLDDTT
ncbi:MAG: hypothetical protein PVF58_15380 [Candidatus Methanofastidiosia archaeon]